jgi:hypothetical protein
MSTYADYNPDVDTIDSESIFFDDGIMMASVLPPVEQTDQPGWILALDALKKPDWIENLGGGSGSTPGLPTASVGTAAVNGVASTFMRSDAAPRLSQAIVPTWTGAHRFDSLVSVRKAADASAMLAFAAGTTTLTPIRLATAGAALLATPLSGAIETDGTSLYFTSQAGVRTALGGGGGGSDFETFRLRADDGQLVNLYITKIGGIYNLRVGQPT